MADRELSFEQVEVGDEIPSLAKNITVVQMAMYAAATWDFARGHYDREFALKQGFRDVYLDGQMLGAFLAQLMADWIGERGALRRLGLSYRGMVFPGDTLTCQGKVTGKYIKVGQGCLDVEMWINNQKGERVAPGTATAILPLRGSRMVS